MNSDNFKKSENPNLQNESDDIQSIIGLGKFSSRKSYYPEMQKMIEQLKEEKNKAQNYLDIAGVIILALDRVGKVTLINKKGSEILGYDQEEIYGKNWFDHFIPNHLRTELKKQFENIISGKTEYSRTYENRILTKDGKERIISWQNSMIKDALGNIQGTLSSGEDITESKLAEIKLLESEKKFKTIFEAAPDAYYLNDLDGNFIDGNKVAEKLIGYKKEDIVNKNFFELNILPKDQIPKVIELLKKNANNESTGPDELRLINKSGTVIDVEITTHPVKIKEKTLILGIVRDITERKKAISAIIENQRLGAIGEMVSAVAHDFNNSLQSILGNLELALNKKGVPDSILKYLLTAKTVTSDAAMRVKLLQRFSGKKNAESEKTPTDINQIIKDAIQQTRPLWKDEAEKSGLYISIKPKMKDVKKVLANPAELRAVLYNLIKNSIEAMPKGGEISIESDQDDEFTCIRVSDTGIGMDNETKQRVFQPFYTTKDFSVGRGLGMSGAFSIINEHEGKIYVKDTAPQKGTTIEIILPSLEIEENKNVETPITKFEGKARILFVDDDEMIRDIFKDTLDALEYDGDVVESGTIALSHLAENKYDVVITDIGMPGMTGWQLADEIMKRTDSKQKVAVLTGWGSQISDEEKKEHGVDYILEKPVRLSQIVDLISQIKQAN